MKQDFIFALRLLRRQPLFTSAVIFCLALGIGATTAMFTVVDAVLLEPLPYTRPDGVVRVLCDLVKTDLQRIGVSVPEYIDYQEQLTAFSETAAFYGPYTTNLRSDGETRRVEIALASASLFPLLGAEAAEGRVYSAAEDVPGNQSYALLSDRLWRAELGGSPEIVGRTLLIDDESYQVLGVMPPSFRFPEPEIDLWVPLGLDLANPGSRRFRWLSMVARLAPGTDLETARAELELFEDRLRQEHGEAYSVTGWQAYIVPLREDMVRNFRLVLLVLFTAVGLLLLLVSINVANLLLVRAVRRESEIAIRTAMGAGRWSLTRQLLTESLVLGLGGGLAGLGVAWLLLRVLASFETARLPRLEEITVDHEVFLFALAAGGLTSVLFGIFPALQSFRGNLVQSLKDSGRAVGMAGGRRLRAALVVGEIALALMVLVGAGLMVKSFLGARAVDPGVAVEDVLTLQVNVSSSAAPETVTSYYDAALERLAALPEVASAGAISHLPLTAVGSEAALSIEGRQPQDGDAFPSVDLWLTTPDLTRAMGIPLVEGRLFDSRDVADRPLVALIDEKSARRFWPETTPIGQRVRLGSTGEGPPITIVGVVGHVKHAGLDVESKGQLYLPHAQRPARAMYLALRLRTSDPGQVAAVARDALREVDANQPISRIRTMEQVLSESLAERRFTVSIFLFFGIVALLLAAVGIYGVISYSAVERRHDIGIRMAMGAQRGDILRWVLGEGSKLSGAGILIGLLGAFMLASSMRGLLFQVGATDPLIYGSAALILLVIALLASYIPARRAAALEPATVLRAE